MSDALANEPPLLSRFRRMVGMRQFEEACLKGFAAREIRGELHLGIGQEAVAAGMAEHLRPEDALVSTHRNHLHALAKGVAPLSLMAEIFERETGLCFGRGGHMHPFAPDVNFSATGIVGSSIPVAAGYAYAFAMEGLPRVAVAIAGDGATNIGAFHECLNMAAAWKLPLLVVVENNSYAISVRFADVMATPTIAERAAAYGIPGHRIDGTDVDAVAALFGAACASARAGGGPVLIEAMCSRFRGHYEGDADTYRPRADRVRMREADDPILKARARLIGTGVVEATLATLEAEAAQEAETLLAAVRAAPFPAAEAARQFVFADAGAT
jgi:TPP-dependent pyruvate/acetoin dehydrogenase alpha subunit